MANMPPPRRPIPQYEGGDYGAFLREYEAATRGMGGSSAPSMPNYAPGYQVGGSITHRVPGGSSVRGRITSRTAQNGKWLYNVQWENQPGSWPAASPNMALDQNSDVGGLGGTSPQQPSQQPSQQPPQQPPQQPSQQPSQQPPQQPPQQAGGGLAGMSSPEIVEAAARGDLTEDEAVAELVRRGASDASARSMVRARKSAGGAQPADFIKNLEGQIGSGDFLRRYALESGVSPMYQEAAQRLVGQQNFPFAVQQAMAGDFNNPDPQGAFLSFLRGQQGGGLGGGASIGQSLRSAANFLRSPGGAGGLQSEAQEALRPYLTDPTNAAGAANVGSALFDPAMDLMFQPSGLNFAPGLGATGRTGARKFLENYLAQNPTQFGDISNFLDFAQQRGLI